MKKLLKNNAGLTLVEMIIVIAVIGILSAAITRMFLSSVFIYQNGNEQAINRSMTSNAIEVIKNEVTYANQANVADISQSSYPADGRTYIYVDENVNSATYGHLMASGSELFEQASLGGKRFEVWFSSSGSILTIRLQVYSGDEVENTMETSVDLVNVKTSIGGITSGGNALSIIS